MVLPSSFCNGTSCKRFLISQLGLRQILRNTTPLRSRAGKPMSSSFLSNCRRRPSRNLHAGPHRYFCWMLPCILLPLLSAAGCGSGAPAPSTAASTGPTLSITTQALAQGTVGTAYAGNLCADGGSGSSYTWTLSSGSLPTGLSLRSHPHMAKRMACRRHVPIKCRLQTKTPLPKTGSGV